MARILVIDDEEIVCSMYQLALEHEGYEVDVAHNGEEGMRLFRQIPSDLIITDIVMPGQEGFATIMAFHRDFPDVKIIVVSGACQGAPNDYLDIACSLGAERAFRKPFDLEEFLGVVDEFVSPFE